MMRTLIALAAVLLLAVILVALLLHWSEQDQRRLLDETYIALEADRAEREAALEAQYAAYRAQMTVAVQTALVGLLLMGAGAGAAVLARLAWGYASGERAQLRLAELALAAGRDVSVADLNNRHPMPIAHFAPSLHIAPRVTTQPTAELPAPDVAIGNVPTFAELLSAGKVGQGNPLLLGIADDGGELVGSWLDLYSTAVGGLPGTGKSTSQRFLAAQTALHGARFVVADPHYGATEDSLGGTLSPLLAHCGLCDVASDDKAIVGAVKLVADIGRKRIAGDKDRTPIILWIDESTALLNRSTVGPSLAELLEGISQEFRKVAVYASISGQIWTADRAGGSALRDSLASCLVHRMKRQQARMLVPTDTARLVEGLSVGRAILYRTSGQVDTVTIPNTTSQDIKTVAGLLTDSAPTTETGTGRQPAAEPVVARKPDGSQIVAIDDPATTAPLASNQGIARLLPDTIDSQAKTVEMAIPRQAVGNGAAKAYTAEERRMLDMFKSGASVAEIAREVSGAKNGRRYTDASERVQRVVREAVS